MKDSIPLSRAIRVINPGPVVLVTSKHNGVANVMAAAWTTPISHVPPLVGVSISPERFSHELITQSNEFVLNVCGLALAREVKVCGTISGRAVDKFAEVSLTPVEAELVSAPLIEECLGHLECKVFASHSLGDHTLFVGEVVAAQACAEAFSEIWLLGEREASPLHHLGGAHFGVLQKGVSL